MTFQETVTEIKKTGLFGGLCVYESEWKYQVILPGTDFALSILRVEVLKIEEDNDSIKHWYRRRTFAYAESISFEEVLEGVAAENRTALLFHLDLFT